MESILSLNAEQQTGMAEQLALACGCTVLVSGRRMWYLTEAGVRFSQAETGESAGSPGAAVCSLPCVLFSAEPDRNLLQRRCRPDRSGKKRPGGPVRRQTRYREESAVFTPFSLMKWKICA